MGSNTSMTSAMAKSIIAGETSISTIINNNANQEEEHHQHSDKSLSKESQWSKSSPALKPPRPYRSSMKRSSRSVPNKMDAEFQKVKQDQQKQQKQKTTPSSSNDSSPSTISSSPSSSSSATPTTSTVGEVQILEDQNASTSKQTNVKSKNRPNAITYANFLNHSHTLTLTDESIQDRYFDRYYPPLPADVEEKLKVVDKKARPKTANAYVKAKSASNLKISAPSSSSNISLITITESSSPQNHDNNINNNNNGNNTPLVAKPMSPIVSLYSKTSSNNQSAPRSLARSSSHSFGLTSYPSSTTRTVSPSANNNNTSSSTLHPHHHAPLQRSSSHSIGLSHNNATKSPTHSPSISPHNNSLQPHHHTFQRSNSQSSGMLTRSNLQQQKSPSSAIPHMPQTFHKLPTEGTTMVG
ncbi:predicted protein [Naegleria gruberi]|uniref:Predicted protein n=1 Tax=Naegleria gruberi TaxID=5762 RepID=D2VN98_NAEGR|nr:uncharacterized protein NAEGRDRAFT_70420 [Naegleria gruberi]EFC41615.1 predicted protein [Naegleria gruberi]|eukprot:XP_002674359.1 predicted protein [Naegleria gruberi strain NEG-M]